MIQRKERNGQEVPSLNILYKLISGAGYQM
jgi:hypothetical protein